MARQPAGPASALSPAGPAPPMPSAGIHIAQQDSTPMILFVGQVERRISGAATPCRNWIIAAVFGGMTKWAARDRRAGRMAEYGRPRLFHRAGRAARARWCWRCRMTCWPSRPIAATRHLSKRPETAPGADRHGGAGRSAGRRPSARCCSLGGSALERGSAARRSRASRERFGVPVATSYRRAPSVRSAAPQLCRRSGPAGQSQTGGAGQGQRPGDRGGRAPQRDHHARIIRCSTCRAADEAGACLSRRRTSWAGSFARIWPSMPRPRAFAAALDGFTPRARRAGAAKPRPPMPTIAPCRMQPLPQPGDDESAARS